MRPIRDSRSRLEGRGAEVAPLPIGNNRVGARQVVVAQFADREIRCTSSAIISTRLSHMLFILTRSGRNRF